MNREFSICLRCQVKILSRQNKLRPSAKRHALSAYDRGSRAFTRSSKRRQHDEDVVEKRLRASTDQVFPSTRRLKLDHVKASLGVESLGDPAEALVLRRSQRKDVDLGLLHPYQKLRRLPERLESSPEDLSGALDADSNSLSDDQACLNIDELRSQFAPTNPNRGGVVNLEEYRDLQRTLRKGFEKEHLAEYICRYAPLRNEDPLAIDRTYSSDLFSRSAWHSKAESPSNFQAPLLGDHNLHVQKYRPLDKSKVCRRTSDWLSEYIIASLWNIYPQKPDDVVGELVMRLQTVHLDLLLDHSRSPLKTLSEAYSATLETSRHQGLLRIESTYRVSTEVIRKIVDAIELIGQTSINVDLAGPQRGKDAILGNEAYKNHVAALTNTVILQNTQLPSDGAFAKYDIHYLGPESTDLEDAKRLLVLGEDRLDRSLVHEKELSIYRSPTVPILVAPVASRPSLPLFQRKIQWGRLTHAIISEDVKQDRADSSLPKRRIKMFQSTHVAASQVINFLQKRPLSPQVQHDRFWGDQIVTSTSVMFGKLLVPYKEAKQYQADLKAGEKLKDFREKMRDIGTSFIPDVPALLNSLGLFVMSRRTSSAVEERLVQDSVVVQLVPGNNYDLPPDTAKALPLLEIHFVIPRATKMATLAQARLIVNHSELDLMLPARMMDLRFRNTSYVESSEVQSDPCLADFLAASELDIYGISRLRTPSQIRITVPPQALARLGSSVPPTYAEGVSTHYVFSKLEHRSSTRLRTTNARRSRTEVKKFSEHSLSLNTIEAGRVGGSRDELVLLGMKDPTEVSEAEALSKLTDDSAHNYKVDQNSDDGNDYLQHAKALGPKGRARRLFEAALNVCGDIELKELGNKQVEISEFIKKNT